MTLSDDEYKQTCVCVFVCVCGAWWMKHKLTSLKTSQIFTIFFQKTFVLIEKALLWNLATLYLYSHLAAHAQHS